MIFLFSLRMKQPHLAPFDSTFCENQWNIHQKTLHLLRSLHVSLKNETEKISNINSRVSCVLNFPPFARTHFLSLVKQIRFGFRGAFRNMLAGKNIRATGSPFASTISEVREPKACSFQCHVSPSPIVSIENSTLVPSWKCPSPRASRSIFLSLSLSMSVCEFGYLFFNSRTAWLRMRRQHTTAATWTRDERQIHFTPLSAVCRWGPVRWGPVASRHGVVFADLFFPPFAPFRFPACRGWGEKINGMHTRWER